MLLWYQQISYRCPTNQLCTVSWWNWWFTPLSDSKRINMQTGEPWQWKKKTLRDLTWLRTISTLPSLAPGFRSLFLSDQWRPLPLINSSKISPQKRITSRVKAKTETSCYPFSAFVAWQYSSEIKAGFQLSQSLKIPLVTSCTCSADLMSEVKWVKADCSYLAQTH